MTMNILAIDIGGSQCRTAVATISHTGVTFAPISQRHLPSDCSKEKLFAALDESIAESAPAGNYERIGITIPGLADSENGIWKYACFSGIRNVPIAKIMSEKLGGKPAFIDNDVNACALAERYFGNCRETKDFLWMTVSNGIGGGLVLDGKIYRGHFGNAGEIGHFCVVEENGTRCGCGHYGCLEAEAAGPGIARRYAVLRKDATHVLTAKEIADRARQGDELAISVFDTTGFLIGKAASFAVNLLNLEKVVIGGGVSRSFDLLLPLMESSFRSKIFGDANPNTVFAQTGLGYDAGLVGAAALTNTEFET